MIDKDKIMDLLNSIDTVIVSPFAEYDEQLKAIHGLTDAIRKEINK